jgi:hypothetical protein
MAPVLGQRHGEVPLFPARETVIDGLIHKVIHNNIHMAFHWRPGSG